MSVVIKITQKLNALIVRTGQIFLWLFSKLIVGVFLKVDYDKQANITTITNPTFVVSNHVSLFDAAIFVGALSWREFRSISPLKAMLAKWYYHSPLIFGAYLVGCFPSRPLVKRWKKYAGVSGALKNLENGNSLGLYPEGRRRKDERLKAKYGVVKILQKSGADSTVYLCKITPHKTKSRRFNVIISRDDGVASLNDPDKIMDAIYDLK